MADVPRELREQVLENVHRLEGLRSCGLPLRFQAMVIGLASLKQANTRHDQVSPDHTSWSSSVDALAP